jgi:hypothetical protein
MDGRLFSPVAFAAGAIVALSAPRALAETVVSPPEKVRVDYAAPPECPDRQAFLAAVRARVGTDWEAPDTQLAHAIDVQVMTAEGRSVARIEFLDVHGQRVTRTVAAATCADVVSGIALVTALAIESRVTGVDETAGPASGSAAPAASGVPPVASSPLPPPEVPKSEAAAAAAPAPAPAPASPRREPLVPRHYDVGGGGLVAGGAGPTVALGARLFAGVGWDRGPDFRIGADYARSIVDVQNGVDVWFAILGGRLSACPWAFGVAGVARVLPCVGASAGVHHGEGLGSSRYQPGSANPFFFTPFASLRAEASLDALFLEVEAEGRFSFYDRSFNFGSSPSDPDAYQVPTAALGLSVGVGLRL